MQKAYKATYPPGDAREDWVIFKDLANKLKKPLGYKSIEELRDLIKKNIVTKSHKQGLNSNKPDFVDENISIKFIDYYYTNPIARSSKVMSECRQIPKNFLFTGIEKGS